MTLLRAHELREQYRTLDAPGELYAHALDLAIRLNKYNDLQEDESSLIIFLDSVTTANDGVRSIKKEFLNEQNITLKDKDGNNFSYKKQTLKEIL